MPTVKALRVNGSRRAVAAEAGRSLLAVLRDDLGLTGSHYGCGEGRCGACTVLLDGEAVLSCTTRVRAAVGKKILTIEGVAKGAKLHPLQEAFLQLDAFQCGYCTPGMILSALALLEEKPEPTREDIVTALDGNICRCGAYARIVTAVERAAKRMQGATNE
jgi:aerobic-type carbon monoxide dehydrogenase small subunit (CoxS/CutS family)